MRTANVVAILLCWAVVAAAAGPKLEKMQIDSGGQKRTYYIYVPEKAKEGLPPLLLLLHGSGQTGAVLVKNWKSESDAQGIVLVGPDANNREKWDSSVDSPDFLRDVIVDVISRQNIDTERLYIFGHSGGAMYGIMLALMESKYFAAAGVHAGALHEQEYVLMGSAQRKIPIGLWCGDWDETVPTGEVRKTYEEFKRQGFPVVFNPIPKHTHNYYALADVINDQVWRFLKDKRNDSPEFTHYDWNHPKQLPAKNR